MKTGRFAIAGLLLLAILAGVSPSPAYIQGKWCREPQDIAGFGTPTQFRLHYEVFIPTYEAACQRGAGVVSYFTGDESTTFQRILYRGPDFDHFDSFWARDSALNELESAQVTLDTGRGRLGVTQVGHFPIMVLGLSVAYNLNCTQKPLNLSAMNLSLMYLGSIERWNDPRLVADNPELGSCDRAIRLTGRADSSGEALTFKSYLAKRNPVWTPYAQPQLNTQWPAPLVCRGGGDNGAAGCVASNTGSVGFVGIENARRMGLRVAKVERITVDKSAPQSTKIEFVAPSLAGCTKAAESVDLPPGFSSYSNWSSVSLVDARAGYPICYFSFVLAYQQSLSGYSFSGPSEMQALTLRDYLDIIFRESTQQSIARRGYGRVPAKFLALNREGLDSMQSFCQFPLSFPREIDDPKECFELFTFLDRKLP